MAQSNAHKFGQIIGDLLELAITPCLQQFVNERGLYLDKKGERPARKGKKVSWTDGNGNVHDLDFVIERGGTDVAIGAPVAFIESAWRRYTKHSRNKAQEIQGAIIPLRNKYQDNSPFIGVILAGDFTGGAINQLKSLGFSVLYFTYEMVQAAFRKFGIDVFYDEDTSEDDLLAKVNLCLASAHIQDIATALFEDNKAMVDSFIVSLNQAISKRIEHILILPLHGQEVVIATATAAIDFLNQYEDDKGCSYSLSHYLIIIEYSTGDRIEAKYKNKAGAIEFLQHYL